MYSQAIESHYAMDELSALGINKVALAEIVRIDT